MIPKPDCFLSYVSFLLPLEEGHRVWRRFWNDVYHLVQRSGYGGDTERVRSGTGILYVLVQVSKARCLSLVERVNTLQEHIKSKIGVFNFDDEGWDIARKPLLPRSAWNYIFGITRTGTPFPPKSGIPDYCQYNPRIIRNGCDWWMDCSSAL